MDIASLQGAVGSLKLAFDLTKKFLEMKSLTEVQSLVIALQREILTAQSGTFAAQADQATMAETVRALKEEIARIKAWEGEKQRYALVTIVHGAVAYSLKDECKGAEPPHWICTTCYENGVKSILNPRMDSNKLFTYCCPRCSADIQTFRQLPTPAKYAT